MVNKIKFLSNVFKDRNILVIGHTGFKGAWLSIWLHESGANVAGFSLESYENDYIFRASKLGSKVNDERGDIRSFKQLQKIFAEYKPEIVFHLAAQSLVRKSYNEPVGTFETNIIGTVNVLECIRLSDSVKSAIIVTSDKCYKNKNDGKSYKEDDELGGHDPYSASKACAEIVTGSYGNSFFGNSDKCIASVRAGNVLGGGDFAKDRLVPDCIRALQKKEPIKIRNPDSKRPWQHVLEPIYGYMLLAEKLAKGQKRFAEAWNFGPDQSSTITVKEVADLIIRFWGEGKWIEVQESNEKMMETEVLSLDSTKARKMLGWKPVWNINTTLSKTVDWYKKSNREDAYKLCVKQIKEFTKKLN